MAHKLLDGSNFMAAFEHELRITGHADSDALCVSSAARTITDFKWYTIM